MKLAHGSSKKAESVAFPHFSFLTFNPCHLSLTSALKTNPNSWNKKANVLYLEGPPGVGFTLAGSVYEMMHNDEDTSRYSIEALSVFLTVHHTEFLGRDLYFGGEAYAGISIPWLGFFMRTFNNFSPFKFNIKGVMIGNGVTIPRFLVDPSSIVEYLYQHALINEATYSNFMNKCKADPTVSGCDTLLDQAQTSLDGLNPYNINGQCHNTTSPSSMIGMNGFKSWARKEKNLEWAASGSEKSCVDAQGVIMLLNSVDFRKAFYTSSKVATWDVCSTVCYEYFTIDDILASYWIYPFFITLGIKVLVYSGDLDAAVPITDTLTWLTDLQKELKLQTVTPWGPWYMNGEIPNESQTVGNVWQLQNLTYVSIKGAGGMVPQDKGAEAWTMMDNFINDVPFNTSP